MSRKILSLLLAFALLALPVVAQAGVVTDYFNTSGALNEIKFQNREVLLDANLQLTDKPMVDGYLVSLFSATQIFSYSTPGTPELKWEVGSSTAGYLLGYAVQKITSVGSVIEYGNTDQDPSGLGKIANGETLVIYNSTHNWDITNGDWAVDLGKSLDSSTLWASFGIAAGTSNQASFAPFPFPVTGFLGLATYGLNVVQNPNGLVFDSGQSAGNDIAGTATVWAPPPGYPGGNNWTAFSNDPVSFALVPEPATLAMWGSFLAVGAAVALRRRQK